MTDNMGNEYFPQNEKNNPKRKVRWLRIVLIAVLACVVIGGGIVAGVCLSIAKDTPDLSSVDLDSYSVTTSILDKDGNSIGNLHAGENRVPVDFDEISPNAVNALVAIEDQRFYSHKGVDPIRIGGAMIANLKAGGIVQGGSTITQQLTGLVFLDRTEKSYTRKLKEAILALEVEKEYTKDEIITHYLNRAYFGGGAYGIEAASIYFFGKPASDLTVPEAATLAGCIQNPSKWSPIGFPENSLTRRNLVLDQMAECGFITKDEAEAYKATEIVLSDVRVTAKSNEGSTPYQSYINHVIEEALDVLELENDKDLYTGGYVIYTAMDQAVQQRMEQAINNDGNFPNANIQAAMVVTDAKTGAVRGIVGGRHQSAARELNRATQSYRQPGSAFKPVAVYAPAFEAGYGPGTVVDDYPKDYNGHVFLNSNRTYNGLVPIRKAIVSSLNVVAVKTMEMTGIDTCYKFAKQLGFSKLDNSDRNLSTALGGLTTGVSPLELAGAYGTFANEGVYIEPYAITKIVDQKGKVLWENDVNKKSVMSEQSAYLLTNCLQDAVSNGTGSNAKVSGHPTAGKTGTTSDNKDAWFAGYTQHYVGVVWIGYDTPKQLGSNAFGGTLAAPIFGKVMNTLHANLPAEKFSQPSGITTVTIDTKSGLRASELTPAQYTANELFNSKYVPKGYSDVWREVEVCPVSGQKLSDGCPGPAETKVALVRKKPWVPINNLVPADASLELKTPCETHAGQAAAGITLSGDGQYDADGNLKQVDLKWTAAEGEGLVYTVCRSTSTSVSDKDAIAAVTKTSYTDAAPVEGSTNYYRIIAINEETGDEVATSKVMSFKGTNDKNSSDDKTDKKDNKSDKEENTPADAPVALAPINLSGSSNNGAISLSWNAPGNGNYQYRVFRNGSRIGQDTTITDTYFTDSTVVPGLSYAYRVICVQQGNEIARSSKINVQN